MKGLSGFSFGRGSKVTRTLKGQGNEGQKVSVKRQGVILGCFFRSLHFVWKIKVRLEPPSTREMTPPGDPSFLVKNSVTNFTRIYAGRLQYNGSIFSSAATPNLVVGGWFIHKLHSSCLFTLKLRLWHFLGQKMKEAHLANNVDCIPVHFNTDDDQTDGNSSSYTIGSNCTLHRWS